MSNSNNIHTIEKLINNYYNNNLLQKGGNNKLDKNIVRLYNCYVLSQNQNQDKLSLQIKTRLDNKIIKLADELIGGTVEGEVVEGVEEVDGYLWGKYKSKKELNLIEEATQESDSLGNYIKKILIDYINKLKLNTTRITLSLATAAATAAANSVKKAFTNKDNNSVENNIKKE